MLSSSLFLFFVPLALARPLEQRAAAPSVTITNGTVVGSTTTGIDSFKGIPFAEPPVGQLRLKPPQSITSNFGTITATGVPTACPQFYSQVNTSNLPAAVVAKLLDSPIAQAATVSGENCLTLNVQRPSTATSSSKLPVIFWIFGGKFAQGVPIRCSDAGADVQLHDQAASNSGLHRRTMAQISFPRA